MADDCEARDQKTLETIKLSCLPSYPGGVSWSLDDRISVITDQCVYILVSFYILTRYKSKRTYEPGLARFPRSRLVTLFFVKLVIVLTKSGPASILSIKGKKFLYNSTAYKETYLLYGRTEILYIFVN